MDRVLYGKLMADNASYCALVYLTADNLITDQDLVDD